MLLPFFTVASAGHHLLDLSFSGASRHQPQYHKSTMSYPIKTCVVCGEEFELKPDKPGFANRCPNCSEEEGADPKSGRRLDAEERKTESEANAERRKAIRDLLYKKDS